MKRASPRWKVYPRYCDADEWIYFVEAVGLGLVKIGRSGDPKQRIAGIQAHSPVRVQCIELFQGPAIVELLLHALLDSSRSHGEWFFLTEDVKAVLRRVGRKNVSHERLTRELVATLRSRGVLPGASEAHWLDAINVWEHKTRQRRLGVRPPEFLGGLVPPGDLPFLRRRDDPEAA